MMENATFPVKNGFKQLSISGACATNCLQAMAYARVHKLTSVAHRVYLYIVGTEALPMADVFCAKASTKKYTAVG